jgi:hypothetical protein
VNWKVPSLVWRASPPAPGVYQRMSSAALPANWPTTGVVPGAVKLSLLLGVLPLKPL